VTPLARTVLWGASLLTLSAAAAVLPAPSRAVAEAPIEHVVIVFQENHTFDNVLGKFCHDVRLGEVQRADTCRGHVVGWLPHGGHLKLHRAIDVVPNVSHTVRSQRIAIDGGKMDGFALIRGCRARDNYRCYSQFTEKQIPNAIRLAKHFAISDATFELRQAPSWGGHLMLAAGTLAGFRGNNPVRGAAPHGMGCDSGLKATWTGVWEGDLYTNERVPSCVPDQEGDLGPAWSTYEGIRAGYVPTIFDRLEQAGHSWKLYAGKGPDETDSAAGYQWTICPTFYECLGSTAEVDSNFVPSTTVIADALDGTLPEFAIVTPTETKSQHNTDSMARGDDWIGRVVSAIMEGPDWSSTAIFLTWDDCGCFFDHMNPLALNPEWGIRVPMIIVSPFARPGYTDPRPATFASLLTFTETMFGLDPLNPCATQKPPDPNCTDDLVAEDGQATYDYSEAFDFTQQPLGPVEMTVQGIPRWERKLLRSIRHPVGNGT
jgi:phospholipase C